MSLYAYKVAQAISAEDPPFYALIQAAMRKADTQNLELLTQAFPLVRIELMARYNAPGGLLEGEHS